MAKSELPNILARPFQKEWDLPMVELDFQSVKHECCDDIFGLARLNASSTPEAGDWLNVLPLKSLRTLLTNEELRVSVSLRLGTDICHQHTCRCRQTTDTRGYHGLSCRSGGATIYRHDQICDILCDAANSAGLRARREPRNLCSNDEKRPDVIISMPILRGLPWAADVTCVNTVAPEYIAKTTALAGSGAEFRERQKAAKFEELHGDFAFSGIGVETLGAHGPEAKRMIRHLGNMIKERLEQPRAYEFSRQRISISLQRGNAKCVLGTFKEARGLAEIFYTIF